MPRKSLDVWLPDERGRYRRKVGWWEPKPGARKLYKFDFGSNKDQASGRFIRVKELWARVEELAQNPPEKPDSMGIVYEAEAKEPLWDGESLWIAKQLAAGNVQIVVERASPWDESTYFQFIRRLAEKYPFVHFVPENWDAYNEGLRWAEGIVQPVLERVGLSGPTVNIESEASKPLHKALDAYIAFIEKTDLEPTPDGPSLTPFGSLKVEQAKRLKQRHSDRPLSKLDYDGCQELLDYWRMRPLTNDKRIKKARPMARKTCENHVSELMRFFRWLRRQKEFGWRKPEDFDELLTGVKDMQEERTEILHTQVRVYLPDELAILNKYATPLERLLLLLGLNCGFKGAEQGTLLLDHVFLDTPHPNARYLKDIQKYECRTGDRFILYKRNKTKVYGEFLLWPQTIELLRWAAERQARICSERALTCRNLLITDRGTLFYRLTSGKKNQSQIFGNKWDAWIKRIRKDHADFPDYSFSSLRDTASDMVRHVSDGEISSVFLLHGQPVKSDDLLEIYTNRPFGKVFDALRQLEQDLKKVFDAVPQGVVEQPMQQYTPLSKREMVLELKKQGKKVKEIMEETGLSRMTVLRTIQRLWYKMPGSQPK